MKVTWKSFIVSVLLLFASFSLFWVIDGTAQPAAEQPSTALKVVATDLDGNPIHNAEVTVLGSSDSFFTDNRGRSPSIAIEPRQNCYDASVTDWFTVNVRISADNYADAFCFNCVITSGQLRVLSVRLYPSDGTLPYVCYVESPPDDYVKSLQNPRN